MNKPYRKIKFMALTMAVMMMLALTAQSVMAASLWPSAGGANNLFSDRRANSIGDILTIIIREDSKATRTGSANNSKDSSNAINAGTGIFSAIAAASAGGKDSFKAQGTLTNSNTVTGRVTVTVIEVKPNGNLVLSGTQSIKQNNEEQKITITGEVRPEDVNNDNTVLSSYVANAQIKLDGKGPIASKQRQGLITQLLNFLF